MWVKLQLDELCCAENDDEIRRLLQEIPKDLCEYYDRILSQITGEHMHALVYRMLQWIAVSRRPLTVHELGESVGFPIKSLSWQPEMIIAGVPRLIRACGGLVQLDENSQTVQFAHHTVRQYISSTTPESMRIPLQLKFTERQANNLVGVFCMAYLHISGFEGLRFERNQLPKLAGKYRMLNYVTENWLWHTRYFGDDQSSGSPRYRLEMWLNLEIYPFYIRPWMPITWGSVAALTYKSYSEYFEPRDRALQVLIDQEKEIQRDDISDEDSELGSDATSIFSMATQDSGTYASSASILVQAAEEQFVAMLAEDLVLIPLYETAAIRLKPERFERNFARLLKLYAEDLRKEATDSLQKAAVQLVRSRRKPTAASIRRKFFPNNEQQNHKLDQYILAQKIDRSVQLDDYIARCQQNDALENAAPADRPIETARETEDPVRAG